MTISKSTLLKLWLATEGKPWSPSNTLFAAILPALVREGYIRITNDDIAHWTGAANLVVELMQRNVQLTERLFALKNECKLFIEATYPSKRYLESQIQLTEELIMGVNDV